MNEISADILEKLQKLKPLMKAMHVSRMRVFGSVARGEADENSDIDLLLDFEKTPGLALYGLPYECGKILGRKVDIVTPNSLHPALKEDILQEARDVF